MTITKQFLIPGCSLAGLQKSLGKLNAKLTKAGLEPVEVVISQEPFDEFEESTGNVIRLFEVTLNAPEPIVNGWMFVATIHHLSEGENVIFNNSNQDLPAEFRERGPVCDHCSFNRRRRDTYVVRNVQSGVHTQVGRTCLKDFTGATTAEKIADSAEWIAEAFEAATEASNKESKGIPLSQLSRWSLKTFLGFVAAEIRIKSGYTSKAIARDRGIPSTSQMAFNVMTETYRPKTSDPTEEDAALAESAIEYYANFEPISEFDNNLCVIARSHFVEHKTIGYAAWMIPGFKKTLPTAMSTKGHYPAPMGHVGTVGSKIETIVTIESVKLVESSFGTSWLHTMLDSNGNQLKWFCTSTKAKLAENAVVKISATVKEHKVYKSIPQTMVQRVKQVD